MKYLIIALLVLFVAIFAGAVWKATDPGIGTPKGFLYDGLWHVAIIQENSVGKEGTQRYTVLTPHGSTTGYTYDLTDEGLAEATKTANEFNAMRDPTILRVVK